MPFSSLENRHIVVTGASRGIGRALALALFRHGARISICARSHDAIESLCKETQALGAVLDIRDESAVDNWIDAAVMQYGPIDGLINNAAILGPKEDFKDYPLERFKEVLDVNIMGLVVVNRIALPRMVRPGGVVLHTSSYLGRHGLPRYGAYCLSKFALEGLSQLIAEEYREEGIVSCSVDPGMVQTEMLKEAMECEDVSEHVDPNDAAEAYCKLLMSVDMDQSGTPLDLFPQVG